MQRWKSCSACSACQVCEVYSLTFLVAVQGKRKARDGGGSRVIERRERTPTLACSSFSDGT